MNQQVLFWLRAASSRTRSQQFLTAETHSQQFLTAPTHSQLFERFVGAASPRTRGTRARGPAPEVPPGGGSPPRPAATHSPAIAACSKRLRTVCAAASSSDRTVAYYGLPPHIRRAEAQYRRLRPYFTTEQQCSSGCEIRIRTVCGAAKCDVQASHALPRSCTHGVSRRSLKRRLARDVLVIRARAREFRALILSPHFEPSFRGVIHDPDARTHAHARTHARKHARTHANARAHTRKSRSTATEDRRTREFARIKDEQRMATIAEGDQGRTDGDRNAELSDANKSFIGDVQTTSLAERMATIAEVDQGRAWKPADGARRGVLRARKCVDNG
jgi:hypothetical protein